MLQLPSLYLYLSSHVNCHLGGDGGDPGRGESDSHKRCLPAVGCFPLPSHHAGEGFRSTRKRMGTPVPGAEVCGSSPGGTEQHLVASPSLSLFSSRTEFPSSVPCCFQTRASGAFSDSDSVRQGRQPLLCEVCHSLNEPTDEQISFPIYYPPPLFGIVKVQQLKKKTPIKGFPGPIGLDKGKCLGQQASDNICLHFSAD